MLPLLLGSLSPVHCIRWTGAAPKVHLFTRPGSTPRTPSLATSGAQEKGVSTPQQVQLVASSSTQPPASGPSTALESSASTSFFNSGLSEELHARTSQHASTASSPSCSGRSEGRGGESGSGFIFHQANAYEACGGELVVVDCIRYASMPDFHQVNPQESADFISKLVLLSRILFLYIYTTCKVALFWLHAKAECMLVDSYSLCMPDTQRVIPNMISPF